MIKNGHVNIQMGIATTIGAPNRVNFPCCVIIICYATGMYIST